MPRFQTAAPIVHASSASSRELEEMATALADAVEAWAYQGGASGLSEADLACNLATELRVLGWLCTVDAGDASGAPVDALHAELSRAVEMLTGPPISGVQRKLTPRPGFIEPEVLDDEQTVVRRAKCANRVLK